MPFDRSWDILTPMNLKPFIFKTAIVLSGWGMLPLNAAAPKSVPHFSFYVTVRKKDHLLAVPRAAYALKKNGVLYFVSRRVTYKRVAEYPPTYHFNLPFSLGRHFARHSQMVLTKHPVNGVFVLTYYTRDKKRRSDLVFVTPAGTQMRVALFSQPAVYLGHYRGRLYFCETSGNHSRFLYMDTRTLVLTRFQHITDRQYSKGLINPLSGDILLEQVFSDSGSAVIAILPNSGKVKSLFGVSHRSYAWNRPFDWTGRQAFVLTDANGLHRCDSVKGTRQPLVEGFKCYNPRYFKHTGGVTYARSKIRNIYKKKIIVRYYEEFELHHHDLIRGKNRFIALKVAGAPCAAIGQGRLAFLQDASGRWNDDLKKNRYLHWSYKGRLQYYDFSSGQVEQPAAAQEASMNFIYTPHGLIFALNNQLLLNHPRYGFSRTLAVFDRKIIEAIIAHP